MLVLGIHGGHKSEAEPDPVGFAGHDSAAVLIRDGEILAAIEEERLNRIKHSNCFPVRAVSHCLSNCDITLKDVDRIALNISLATADQVARYSFIEDPTSKLPAEGRAFIASLFEREFGIDVQTKLYFCHHHIAHAWSAFVPSGFGESLILSIDGDGDNASGMVLLGSGHQITKLRQFSLDQSLGRLYESLIKLLGFSRFDEYKSMGLAPYGDPTTYGPILKSCYELLPKGDYWLANIPIWFERLEQAHLVSGARRKSERFTKSHEDLAAALQSVLEKIVFHVLSYYQKTTKQKNLCLAGGVAHNCTLNGKILYSHLFERVFVQPAAHDAGGALGAAWSAYYEDNPHVSFPKLTHVYLGTCVGDDNSVRNGLDSWNVFVNYEHVPDIAAEAAGLLADGSVIGWVQGRSEFGPRALGNRSILADPRPAQNKLRINEMIKKREQFRPFAPSILIEELDRFFEIEEDQGDLRLSP